MTDKAEKAKAEEKQKPKTSKTSGTKLSKPHNYTTKPSTTANHKTLKGIKNFPAVLMVEKGTTELQMQA